jgi:hypothetical protein
MSNHHYVTVAISGTNAAAAANAVKERATKSNDAVHLVKDEDVRRYWHVEPNTLVLMEPYSGMEAVTLITELSEQFPTEKFDLDVSAGYGGGTFQGTMTIQNEQFFDVTDEDDPATVEWDDMVIKTKSVLGDPVVAVYRVTYIGRLGKSTKKETMATNIMQQCEQLGLKTFTVGTDEQCAKMLDLHPQHYPTGAQERCLTPSLNNSTFCWEHQPQPDGKPQEHGWTEEQIADARLGGVIIDEGGK